VFWVWKSRLCRRRGVNLLWRGRRRPPNPDIGGHWEGGKGRDWDTEQRLAMDNLVSQVTCSLAERSFPQVHTLASLLPGGPDDGRWKSLEETHKLPQELARRITVNATSKLSSGSLFCSSTAILLSVRDFSYRNLLHRGTGPNDLAGPRGYLRKLMFFLPTRNPTKVPLTFTAASYKCFSAQ
jgi:hypothetical protein